MPIQQMLVGIGPGEKFAEATGGTVTTVGDYKVHAFTSSGTFTVTQIADVNEFEVLLVAGGAGPGTMWGQGGGGGGGIVNHQTGQALTQADYTVTVGAGGAGAAYGSGWGSYSADGNPGTDSSLKLASNSSIVLEADISDIANLPGMSLPNPQANNKNSWNVYMHNTGGNSAKVVNGVTTQYQGRGGWHQTVYAGGGAGAGDNGDYVNSTNQGATQYSYTPSWATGGGCSMGGGGGDGYATDMVTGSTQYYGGGGGAGTGGAGCSGLDNSVAPGGLGGGGNGSCMGTNHSSASGGVQAQNGTANTGGAGGGGAQNKNSGNGGSGVVYIKYKYQ